MLARERAGKAKPVASATKLMTFRVAARRLDPGDHVEAVRYKPDPGESLAGFDGGKRVLVRDLLYGLMLASGNDAAATLAARAARSPAAFVGRMNGEASRLGLSQTRFADPIGLDAGNASSPRDLADLVLELRADELFRRIVATPEIVVRSGGSRLKLENRNRLVGSTRFVTGVKTGTTLEAGYVLVASASRKDVDLVSVVMGATSEDARDDATLDLLNYGFSLYRERTLVAAGERVGALTVDGARVGVNAAEPVRAVARKDQRVSVNLPGAVAAKLPVERGDVLADARVRLGKKPVGRVGLLAARDISEPDQAVSRGPGQLLVGAAIGVALVLALTALTRRRTGSAKLG